MSVWDFIREAYLGTYAMLMQNWPWLFIVAALIIIVGLVLSDWHSDAKESRPDTLSPVQKDALRAWVMRQKMPPNAPEMVELAQEWLTLCRDAETKERGEM